MTADKTPFTHRIAARAERFRLIQSGATLSGEPLYRARGYREIGRVDRIGADGIRNVIVKMGKPLQ